MTAASVPAPEETQVSKSHPEQWRIHEVAERPDRSLVIALREFATTQIADCGGPVAIVGPPLRHLAGGAQLCGPAVTVWTKEHLAPVLAMTRAVADQETGWRAAIAGGASLPAATGIDDLIGKLAADRASARR
jgi:regulator of RNase E activity RraA